MNNNMNSYDYVNLTSNVNNLEEEKEEKPKQKSGKKILKRIIFILLILLILAGVGLYIYKETVLLDKKKVIRESVSKIFNVLETNIDDINKNIMPFDANEESIGIDGVIKLSSNYSDDTIDLSKLKDYSIKFNNAFDLKNNKLSGSLFLNKNDFSLLSLNTYINGKYGTVESRQLSYYAYNYGIDREIKDIKINNKVNAESIKNIISRTRAIVVSKINDNDITKDTYEETINNKKNTYTRFTYKVNINNLLNDVLKAYTQDTSILNTLSEVSNIDNDTLKQYLQYIIDNNKGNETYNYEIYVDSLFGTFKGMKIYNVESSNVYFRLYEVNNNYEYEFVNGDNKINGKYSTNKLDINIDKTKIEFEKVNNNEYKITNNININNETYKIIIDVKSILEGANHSFKLNVLLSNNDVDVNLDIDLNIYKDATVKPIAAFISKDISTIDENEEADILQKYTNIIEGVIKDIYKGSIDKEVNSIINFKI